ncbi:hypothetical protein EW145_g3756 [Phellinidium pouzarii]|uniref:Uncharacterized protein n=1 Tax=Phellinidium pouzarii TaxID=167371 RepID=A0A4S4L692_9AGAM|nr:hypothetical protein EW145_g3756 [Phellinidium pouzarii]
MGATLGDMDPDTATGKEGDVEARCFQRDSPRDQLIVTLFLLTVFGLLLGAGIKGKMVKAGIDGTVTGIKWWETLFPRTHLDNISLDDRNAATARSSQEGDRRRGDASSYDLSFEGYEMYLSLSAKAYVTAARLEVLHLPRPTTFMQVAG